VVEVHPWRARRSRSGELVQRDTSTHEWLEGRGERIYLISLIDDVTSRLFARFVRHDTREENMRLLWAYPERYGRPLAFYTDQAGMFQVAVKSKRQEPREGRDRMEMPPTRIAWALGELGIVRIPAHSPQAKGRVERQFQTAQDRLVKGMRVAGVRTLEQANAYLETEYLPWWNRTLTVEPAQADDAHRPLGKEHNLAAIRRLSLGHPLGRDPARTTSTWQATSSRSLKTGHFYFALTTLSYCPLSEPAPTAILRELGKCH